MQFRRTLLAATAVVLPVLAAGAQANRRPSPRADGAPPVSATELLNRRRELDLSPRQVARLDSIERSQYAQRRSFMDQMQKQRDSVCADRNPCRLSDTERESFRSRFNGTGANSFRRSDSLGRSLAYSILDSTQRGRVQGWRQGQRRAMMARGGMDRGFGPRGFAPRMREQGFRQREREFQGYGRGGYGRDFGPRMRRPGMQRDRFGPGRGMRRDDFGPGFGPRMRREDDAPDGPPPMGRMGPDGDFVPRRPMPPRGPDGPPPPPARPDTLDNSR